jgi:hypothetical protein
MGKKYIALVSLLAILSFIGYIVYDTISSGKTEQSDKPEIAEAVVPDKWFVFNSIHVSEGSLTSVTVSVNGEIFVGGESFVSCYNTDLTVKWTLKTPARIGAMSVDGDTLYAASLEIIYLISSEGRLIGEWGPYEANSIITSVSANKSRVAFADAGIKRIFVLNKKGEVVSMIGQSDNRFIIPSPYFDVSLFSDDLLYVANTGNHRIETWTTTGKFLEQCGEPGTAPEAFCGCCNPAHFTVVPTGIITAEKGINRIKIIDQHGKFIEYVSSKNSFTPSVPLDVASVDGITIYAANPADSKLYVFKKR